mmetsp:Transcript_30482/g.70290  ORF Transcript_30482/g.70290 Transcript_30482/m.70290 type:complete len:618 (-) Transcript_30482:49-1902(-)
MADVESRTAQELDFASEVLKLRDFIDVHFSKQTRLLENLAFKISRVDGDLSSADPSAGRAGEVGKVPSHISETSEQKEPEESSLDQNMLQMQKLQIPQAPQEEGTASSQTREYIGRTQSHISLANSESNVSVDEDGTGRRPTSLSRGSSKQSFVRVSLREQKERVQAAAESSQTTVLSVMRRMGTMEQELVGSGPLRAFCIRVVSHNMFTHCIMFLILVNLILQGVEVDVARTRAQSDIPSAFGLVNNIIVCVFLMEFILKIVAFGCTGFFCGKDSFWNNLDFVVIFSSVLETLVELVDLVVTSQAGSTSGHLRIMRTMRLVRALRGIRVIRLLRYVSALRTLVFSIVSTMGSLLWTLVLLLLLFYSFGVIFTQLVYDHCREETISGTGDVDSVPHCSQYLTRHWKSVPESMLTLFLAISGGLSWTEALQPLFDVSALAVGLMILYIIVSVFAVLNVVTGVFCNTAIESAQSDKDIAIMKQMRKHDLQVQALRHIFKEIDHDKSNLVTLAELQEALSAKKLSSFLESMGISTQDVSTLFMIIDTDRSGWIDLDEFVSGCMQLHGPAKSLQLAQMSHENKVTRQVIRGLSKSLHGIRGQLNRLTDSLEERAIGTNHLV